ncbi:MAG: Spi family protease inhibitor, partial [Prevotella sp.]|nr:Spi family protease inhibitor [Prevotella sp.]
MKKTTIMFVLCLIATSIWAAPRSQQQALTEAKAFLSKKGIAKVEKISMSFRAPRKQKASNAASYYVFNMEDNKGFVIVSGDDRISPILGYADSGKFDTENMPEHIKAWMDSYTDQLQMIE